MTQKPYTTRDYCGAYTYRNGAVERILMSNGFWQDSVYYAQIKDYQGNVRALLDQNRNLVERNEYYPYGGLINASDSQLQPYKYSSKELDRENGLDLYDFSARMYDPMLPMFISVDPLAEKKPWMSPFAYCSSNPINRIDPYGMADYFNLKGDFIYTIDNGDMERYLVLNRSNKQADIEASVEAKDYILVPNKEIMTKLSYFYDSSEQEITSYPNKYKKGCISIYQESVNVDRNSIYFYHVHGYLSKDHIQSKKIILGEKEYHKVYQDSYNWSNVEQLHALNCSTCFFIGLSMTDPNLRRLLDISKESGEGKAVHYIFLYRTEFDVPFMENTMHSFGINCIWYDNHDDLPGLLDSLMDGI